MFPSREPSISDAVSSAAGGDDITVTIVNFPMLFEASRHASGGEEEEEEEAPGGWGRFPDIASRENESLLSLI